MKQEFHIDLAGVRDAATLHDRIAAVLPLPDGYGRNLDALYDVLTEYGSEWKIVVANASRAVSAFRKVCKAAAKETPGLEIIFRR